MTFFTRHGRDIPKLFLIVLFLSFAHTASALTENAGKPVKSSKTVAVIHCDYPPVSFWNKNTNKPSGFLVDIIDRVASRAGLQVEYICRNNWQGMIDSVVDGEADVTGLLKSTERETILAFTSPVDVTYLSFFARFQSIVETDRAPKGYTVGVVRGSMSYEQLRNRPGVNLLLYGSYQDGIFGLLSGEIGLFAGEDSMILKRAREANLEDRIKKVGKPFLERERGLVVRKDNTQLLGKLNTALHGFVGSPEYQRIYLAWYGKQTPYWTNNRILLASGIFLLFSVLGMAFWRYSSISMINKELVHNITEREKIEAELRKHREYLEELVKQRTAEVIRTAHLASIGELAAGVAHEINNPINSVINYAQVLDDKFPDGSLEKEIAERIKREGNRVAVIVSSLLSFGREQKDDKRPVLISEVIHEALNLVNTQLKKDGIHLKLAIGKNVPEITANPQQLQQVCVNLISNSRYALNRKYPGPHEKKIMEITCEITLKDDIHYVSMGFADYGTGIPSDIIDKVSNPFFTTKPSGQGTGLGLSISRGIIENHGGRLSLESREGEYTRVIVELPHKS